MISYPNSLVRRRKVDPVKYCRRQFLKGAGASIGLPFLSSLAPKMAYGQSAQLIPQKRFVNIATQHGGVFESAMYPSESLLGADQSLYAGHDIRQGNLSASQSNGRTYLSDILSAPSSELTDGIIQKMNVLRGLDIPFYIAHHSGGHLGNYARNDGNGSDGEAIHGRYMPTIDQLMAWSSDFYPDLSSITERSLILGSHGRYSYNWSNPSTRSGVVEETPHHANIFQLFERIFATSDTQQNPPDTFVVDRVIENYRSLRHSNKRLSALDAQRLDDHMDRLFELQRRLNATPVGGAFCSNKSITSWSDYFGESRAWVEVVEAAFLCGSSAIAVIPVLESLYDQNTADWHQSIAHQWNLPGPQEKLQTVNQQVFENIFLNLVNRLNVPEDGDTTILDNTLVCWTHESGEETHSSRSAPVITCGSAGGYFNTGLYMDYRRRAEEGMLLSWGDRQGYSGLMYNQWLATALQAMGLPPSEWQAIEHNAATGYGTSNTSEDYARVQVAGVEANASSVLPGLRAG